MVLESFLGKDAVKQEIFEAIANKAYSDALKGKDIVPVTDPEINVICDEKGKDVVFEAYDYEKAGSQARRIQGHQSR